MARFPRVLPAVADEGMDLLSSLHRGERPSRIRARLQDSLHGIAQAMRHAGRVPDAAAACGPEMRATLCHVPGGAAAPRGLSVSPDGRGRGASDVVPDDAFRDWLRLPNVSSADYLAAPDAARPERSDVGRAGRGRRGAPLVSARAAVSMTDAAVDGVYPVLAFRASAAAARARERPLHGGALRPAGVRGGVGGPGRPRGGVPARATCRVRGGILAAGAMGGQAAARARRRRDGRAERADAEPGAALPPASRAASPGTCGRMSRCPTSACGVVSTGLPRHASGFRPGGPDHDGVRMRGDGRGQAVQHGNIPRASAAVSAGKGSSGRTAARSSGVLGDSGTHGSARAPHRTAARQSSGVRISSGTHCSARSRRDTASRAIRASTNRGGRKRGRLPSPARLPGTVPG